MVFGNISTFYLPTAANAGSSQWGTDVRALLSSADVGVDATTLTNQGTSGTPVVRTLDPYSTSAADSDQSLFGWAITPTDMGSVSGARRFFPAGDHVATLRAVNNTGVGVNANLIMYAYRVGPGPGRTRTLLGSVTGPATSLTGLTAVTITATLALPEVILEADETIQYTFEVSCPGVAVTGRNITWRMGTDGGVATRVDTPGLRTLADTTGTAAGTAAASGVSGLVLDTTGTATGTGAATGITSSMAATTGTAAGAADVAGLASSVAGTTGTAAGSVTVAGQASRILGTVGTVTVSDCPDCPDVPADWPTNDGARSISGTVYNHESGLPLAGATVCLVRDVDAFQVTCTISGAGGGYTFPRDSADPYTYHVTVTYDDAGTQVHGVSDRGCAPS